MIHAAPVMIRPVTEGGGGYSVSFFVPFAFWVFSNALSQISCSSQKLCSLAQAMVLRPRLMCDFFGGGEIDVNDDMIVDGI